MALRPKSFDVLLYLARHPDRVVSKDELMDALWPGVFVTENSLVQCISDIRTALGARGPEILMTVARRGYMFTAPVVEADPGPAEPIAVEVPEFELPKPRRGLGSLPALVAAGAVLLSVMGGAWWWMAGKPVEPQATLADSANMPQKRISIAVLPFTTRDAPEDEYLGDGLTEDIIEALARFSDLTVLTPRIVAPYKGRTPSREEI